MVLAMQPEPFYQRFYQRQNTQAQTPEANGQPTAATTVANHPNDDGLSCRLIREAGMGELASRLSGDAISKICDQS